MSSYVIKLVTAVTDRKRAYFLGVRIVRCKKCESQGIRGVARLTPAPTSSNNNQSHNAIIVLQRDCCKRRTPTQKCNLNRKSPQTQRAYNNEQRVKPLSDQHVFLFHYQINKYYVKICVNNTDTFAVVIRRRS